MLLLFTAFQALYKWEERVMAKICALCGKGKMSGNLVSHSNRKTPRIYSANLQKVKLEIDGKETNQYVCTRCLRTLDKAAK
jgi:large subunit ribosomal protein L28